MNFTEYSKKLKLIEEYINNKWAANPDQLAKKLKVSRRTIFRMIVCLKELGINIEFCKKEKRYKFSDTNQ
jgi:predicted DNA-binding transcriptional regulator YafY